MYKAKCYTTRAFPEMPLPEYVDEDQLTEREHSIVEVNQAYKSQLTAR